MTIAYPAIPLNSLSRHIGPLQEELQQASAQVIASGHYVHGPSVSAFEQEFASYCGVAHCAGVANGTDALEICLRAVGVQAGDRVVLAANAAMYGTTAVLACGAEPVYADVEAESANLDPESAARMIRSHASVKAILVTHLYGRLARLDEISAVCRDAGIALVEDCAQAHGAHAKDGRRAGSVGDVASFSFYPSKNLGALGDGGAIVTNDPAIHLKVVALRQYGWARKYENAIPGGRNSRLDELQARFLCVMLPHLDRWNELRRGVARRYSLRIRHPGIRLPPVAGTEYVAHLYVVSSDRRDALAAHLRSRNVGVDIHYPIPDYRQPMHCGKYSDIRLPVTEMLCDSVLTLPCFPEMIDAEVDAVIDACNAWPVQP